ncbi:MAG: pre-16S rRNA-processing nuclease YqgF [Trueperaceae bacterium]
MQERTTSDTAVLGVDPGRRIGLAWVAADGRLLRVAVVEALELERLEVPAGSAIALGDGTGSSAVRERLAASGHPVDLVDERATSEEGRLLYWRDRPARGWRRLIPVGFRSPPELLDGYAAYAIALRWLASAAA